MIKAFFGDGTKWGVSIDYSLEDRPLGTMGPLRLMPALPENFIVMNGDVLCDLDFSAFMEAHEREKLALRLENILLRERAILPGTSRSGASVDDLLIQIEELKRENEELRVRLERQQRE